MFQQVLTVHACGKVALHTMEVLDIFQGLLRRRRYYFEHVVLKIYISSSACLPLAVAVCKQNQKISKEIESLATPYKSNVSKKIVARLTVLAEVSFLFLSRFVCRLQKT